jgi:hypothetical protein
LKIRYSILGFIFVLIFLIGFSASAVANENRIEIKEGDKFIWRCNICDKAKMRDLLGSRWNRNGTGFFEELEQNALMKWKIDDTEDDVEIYNSETQEDEEFIQIIYKWWIWTKDDDWGDYDHEEEFNLYKDPDDYPDDYIFLNVAPIWLPMPIDAYLKDADLYEGYSIDARSIPTISCEIEKNDMKGDYPTEYIKIQAVYNDKGILRSYKLYINDHEVIVDITLVEEINTIPIIWMVVIPAIFLICYLGLIYVIYKKLINN